MRRLLILLLLASLPAYADDTGFNLPATGASIDTGDRLWAQPTRVETCDSTTTGCGAGTNAGHDILRGTDFSFDAEIDASDTIDGFIVEIDKQGTIGKNITDEVLKLHNGSDVGDNKADTSTSWALGINTVSYGGSSDLWGAGMTTADVRASSFGMSFDVDLGSSSTTAFVDCFKIKVFFSAAGAARRILIIGKNLLDMIPQWRQARARRDRVMALRSTGWKSGHSISVYRQ